MADDALADLVAHIEAKPGVTGDPMGPGGRVTLYKVKAKMFAIVESKVRCVVLKCDPHLIEVLKDKYEAIGHLDRRFWIAAHFDKDIPADEITHLVDGSYDLIVAGLTKKQRAELAALA